MGMKFKEPKPWAKSAPLQPSAWGKLERSVDWLSAASMLCCVLVSVTCREGVRGGKKKALGFVVVTQKGEWTSAKPGNTRERP